MTVQVATEALIAEARGLTECRCTTEPLQECGRDGDHISQLIANMADALESATKDAAEQAIRCNNDRFDLLAKNAPRVVSSVAELDALPGSSVIRDHDGRVYKKDYHRDGTGWSGTGGDTDYLSPGSLEFIEFPATVLWVEEVATNDQ